MRTLNGFDIKYVFFAYIPPFREEEQPYTIQTTVVKTETKTTDYLFKIFDAAIDEAKIEINFNSDEQQNNNIRELILSIVQKKQSNHKNTYSQQLSEILYSATDERNGTGLFAIIEGLKGGTTRLVLFRFKGDEGLYNHGKTLLVDYIPEVFTKKSNHYKLAVYEDIVSDKSFWRGYAIDKQVSSTTYKQISFFWVEEFLNSKTALTPKQGTMQFAKVIKAILGKTSDIQEQEEIISGVVNLRAKRSSQISLSEFCRNYLSEEVSNRIKTEMRNDTFFNAVFDIDNELYRKEFGKTVLNLQDDITAFVPSFAYDKHVKETTNKDGSRTVIIEGRLRSKKINVDPKKISER